jgi:hypothetical protein
MGAVAWLLVSVAAPAAAVEDEAPPPGLLEFLGEFATADGNWIDPVELTPPPTGTPPVDDGGQEND